MNSEDYSAMADLLKLVEVHKGSDLKKLADHANCILSTFSGGVAVIGKMLIYCQVRELSERDFQDLGDLLISMGESINVIRNLQIDIEDAGLPQAHSR